MLPARPSRSPPEGPDPPHYHRPPSDDDRRNPQPPHQQPLSLPSIHQLHPDLPSASLPHHRVPPSYVSGYTSRDPGPSYGTRPLAELSDDEGDPPGPPKKKRRRQALSCTECKRRKIKCDRAQPCGPCSRRGEQSKCQWHIIEPMEKYVTRTEYDDLKARFEHLEATVQRILPSYAMPISSAPHPSTVSPTITGAASPGESAQPLLIQPYRPRGSAGSSYASDMPSPPPSSSARGGEPPYHHSPIPVTRAVEHHSRQRSPPYVYPRFAHNPPAQSTHQPRAPYRSPRALSHTPPPSRMSSAARAPGSRRVSISLAELTGPSQAPFPPDYHHPPYGQQQQQPPKNRHAQTPPQLGRRLRQALPASIGPAAGRRRRRIRRVGRLLYTHIPTSIPPAVTPPTTRLRLRATRKKTRTRPAHTLPHITDASPIHGGVTLVRRLMLSHVPP